MGKHTEMHHRVPLRHHQRFFFMIEHHNLTVLTIGGPGTDNEYSQYSWLGYDYDVYVCQAIWIFVGNICIWTNVPQEPIPSFCWCNLI